MRHFLSSFAFVVVGAAAMACGQSTAAPGEWTAEATATEDQALRAATIVRDIDYVPFEFALDGCYARSLYVAMELAAERIPSTAYYVFRRGDERDQILWTSSEPLGAYHVAAALQAPGRPLTIFDRSTSPEPQSIEDWRARINTRAIKTDEKFSGGSTYALPGVHDPFDTETPILTERELSTDPANTIRSFDELLPFRAQEIGKACRVLYAHLDELRKAGQEGMEARASRLLTRTAELLTSLEQLGKLEATDPIGHAPAGVECGGTVVGADGAGLVKKSPFERPPLAPFFMSCPPQRRAQCSGPTMAVTWCDEDTLAVHSEECPQGTACRADSILTPARCE